MAHRDVGEVFSLKIFRRAVIGKHNIHKKKNLKYFETTSQSRNNKAGP